MKKGTFKVTKRHATNEDYRLLKEFLPHCKMTIGVDFYDAAGNLQLSITKSGKEIVISKAGILVTKLTRHHYRHKIMESIDLLFLKSEGKAVADHVLSRSDLWGKNLERVLGFSSGVYFNPILNDIIVSLVEEQLCFKSSRPISVEDQYHFSGRDCDPEKIQYVCRDQTLLKPLKSITSDELIKVPDKVSAFKLLDALIRVAPNYIAIYILALRALASMLSSPALEGKFKPSFGIILLGETGSQKTSLVEALCYMDEHPYNAVNFKCTPAAVQEKLKDIQDDIVLADDMYPAQITSEKNLQREILSLLIRATGDDIGSRQKMLGGAVTANTSSALFVATAELLTSCSESDLWRTSVLNIRKDDVNKDALTWLQKHPDVLRFYSRLFVQLFTLNDSRVTKLYEDYINARTSLRDHKPDLPSRLVSNCAWLEAAVWTIHDFLEEMASAQSLTDEDRAIRADWTDRHLWSCLETIETIISHQYGRYGSGGDTDTATFAQVMYVVKAMRDDGTAVFSPLVKGERGVNIALAPDKALGFYSPGEHSYVYIKADALTEAVGAYAREHGDNDFVVPSGKAFRALLVQNGLFVKQQHGKNRTKEIRVNGTRHKVTVVFRDELEAWLGPMEQK